MRATDITIFDVISVRLRAEKWTVKRMIELQVAALALCFMALGVLADEMVRMWIRWRR